MTTVTPPGFRLRFLGFFGPQKQPAIVRFGPGLNVLYGASNAGKSFIVEAIDFMLGGGQPLRDFSERVGYDLVLLGIETIDGRTFTVWRSTEGGAFKLFEDLVISGKSRSAFGKGLRAITHAAFTLGLLVFCRARQTPHAGFVVLDSPLLAYREPDGTEDDLRGTDLQEKFYAFLQRLPDDRQVIVVENTDPPTSVAFREQSLMFTKNPHHGRYGLFPI